MIIITLSDEGINNKITDLMWSDNKSCNLSQQQVLIAIDCTSMDPTQSRSKIIRVLIKVFMKVGLSIYPKRKGWTLLFGDPLTIKGAGTQQRAFV